MAGALLWALWLATIFAPGDYECANCKRLDQLVQPRMQDLESALNEGISPSCRVCLSDIHPPVVEGELSGEDCRFVLEWMAAFEQAKRMPKGRGYLGLPPATEAMILLRVFMEIFRDDAIGKHVETGLMRWAEHEFPGKFSGFKKFSPAVKRLIHGKQDHLLCDLLKVAQTFDPRAFGIPSLSWRPSIGELYFKLCSFIVKWNTNTFHPEVKDRVDEIIDLAENEAFTCEGVDFGPLITEVLVKSLGT